MTTIVTLQVHNLKLRDPQATPLLAGFDNASFSEVDHLGLMSVYIEDGQSAVDAALEAARKLANKVPGARVLRVHPDLVSTSEIAHRVGVSREAVRKWVNGTRKPFPTQLDTIGADQRVWRWVEVVEWLLKAKTIDMDEDLPSLADIAHIDACLAKVPDVSSQAWHTATLSPFVHSIASTRHTPTARRNAVVVHDQFTHGDGRLSRAS